MLDSNRLRSELAEIHRALGNVAATARGAGLLDELPHGATAALWQALYADCLRIAHAAMVADGDIGDHELQAFHDLLASAARSYGGAPLADLAGARAFVARYAADRGPFGNGAPVPWPGLALCRRAAEIGDGAALAQYERTMTWLITEACRIGGVAGPRASGRIDELDELRRSLARHAVVATRGMDVRLRAFLSPARVFTSVQQASSVFEDDPFDVDSIHRQARETFEELVESARTGARRGGGRIFLVVGDSGGGKTHLLCDFRRQVQNSGRGFVAYAQLQSNAPDYERYLLRNFVDALTLPYSASSDRTGLHELATGVVSLTSPALRQRVKRLIDGAWGTDSIAGYVDKLVDDLVREGNFVSFDKDLLRVLLYALCPDPCVTSSVYRYLRCDGLSAHDRRWIGDLEPRNGPDDPHLMFRQLARLAALSDRALVVMVDQVDLTGFEQTSSAMFKRAIDALYRITSEIPSAIAVVACLKDLWEPVSAELNRPALDRLENDPAPAWLRANCTYPEIEEVVSRRLQWLFEREGAAFRPEDPTYPITASQLQLLENRRLRDVLLWCHNFQETCAKAGRLIDDTGDELVIETRPPEQDLDQIAVLWNDAMHAQGIEVPTDDDELLAMLGEAARACADETGLEASEPTIRKSLLQLSLTSGTETAVLALAITNRGYQAGAFIKQIDSLRKRARSSDAVAIAVRTLEFPRGEASDHALAQLVKDGGRRAHLDAATLHALAAYLRFQPPFPAERVQAWRRRDQPLARLIALATMFDLERLRAARPVETRAAEPPMPIVEEAPPAIEPISQEAPVPKRRRTGPRRAAVTPPAGLAVYTGSIAADFVAPPVASAAEAARAVSVAREAARVPIPAPRSAAGTRPPAIDDGELWVGTSTGFDAAPRAIAIGAIAEHVAIVGDERATNVTLALGLIEQLLGRGVAVIAIDRLGELSGHARADWCERSHDPDAARALAARIDVRVFTPGLAGGRPLALPVVPELAGATDEERDRAVQRAARGLAALMGFGNRAADAARLGVLIQAIGVLAASGGRDDLSSVISLIDRQDDALVARAARAGCYDDALFKRLVQDLQSLVVRDAALFDGSAEPLGLATLVGNRPAGKTPLSIINTRFLGEPARVQAWLAQLLGCVARAPAGTEPLHTVLVLDEAELALPVGGKTAAKEPLHEVLKLPPGVGVVLVSQRPAELDHRSRDLIHTWFFGRLPDARTNDRLAPLFDRLPLLKSKLAGLERGRFVMLQAQAMLDLERAPSLVRGEAPADDLVALAR